LFRIQLERYPEVRPVTGKRNFPADFVVAVFIAVEDGCGVGVADGVVVCELLRIIRVLIKKVGNVLFECVFRVLVEVFTADDLVDGSHRVALVVETTVKQSRVGRETNLWSRLVRMSDNQSTPRP
jgi:hypothetical protein